MNELRPCPLCGSTQIGRANFGIARHTVICKTCEVCTGYMLDDDEATEAWNTRPIEDALRAKLDAAREKVLDIRDLLRTGCAPDAFNVPDAFWEAHKCNRAAAQLTKLLEEIGEKP
jgi:Lar family restriction alleviation protein